MSTTNTAALSAGRTGGARPWSRSAGTQPGVTPGRRVRGGARLISPVVLLVLWELESKLGIISESKLPSPTSVISEAVTLIRTDSPAYGTLQNAMLVSLERFAAGFALGAVAALLLAVIAGLSRPGEQAIDPIVQMLRTLPLFGLIPVFIVWFGIGQLPKLLLVALASSIPLYLNTFSGIRSVDGKLGEVGQVLGLRRRELIWHIVIPGAMPQVLVGVRQSLAAAWLSLVVAEQINANAGLGFIINQGTQFLQNDVIFVALLVYTILGLLTDWLVRIAERRTLTWRRGLLTP